MGSLYRRYRGARIEQIIDCKAPKLLRYRIIKGSPFINYIGEVRVQSEGRGSRVVWSLRFRSRIPGLGGLLRYVMQRKINATLQGLSNYLSSRRAEGSGLVYRLAK